MDGVLLGSYERDMKALGRRYERSGSQLPMWQGRLYRPSPTAAKMDHRYQTADLQVPFVNKDR